MTDRQAILIAGTILGVGEALVSATDTDTAHLYDSPSHYLTTAGNFIKTFIEKMNNDN